jgi:DNA-binding CsgD family transcriptional regulator
MPSETPSSPEHEAADPRVLLTPAQRRVWDEITRGATNRQIGEHMGISHKTVDAHLANISTRLGWAPHTIPPRRRILEWDAVNRPHPVPIEYLGDVILRAAVRLNNNLQASIDIEGRIRVGYVGGRAVEMSPEEWHAVVSAVVMLQRLHALGFPTAPDAG